MLVSATFLVGFLILCNPGRVCCQSSDTCDWVGSGLQGVSRGVQPLYFRCTQGHIKWHYPRGALRTLLKPPLTKFQGCVRIAANSTGARLYLEGEKRLYPLFKVGDSNLHKCFTSRRGQAALYVEADPHLDILRKDTIEFAYDLELRRNLADDMEECQPCSDEEILKSYCTSDFIIRGTVAALSHNASSQTSEVTVRTGVKYVTLHRPLKCGTKAGRGEFLFLGRWRLGRPTVHCAPRLSYWKEIRRRAIDDGTNLCRLD